MGNESSQEEDAVPDSVPSYLQPLPRRIPSSLNNDEVINLCDSSVEEDGVKAEDFPIRGTNKDGQRRQSEGSTANDAICLFDDDSSQESTTVSMTRKVGATKDEPIFFSDEDSVSTDNRPFVMPKWSPRFSRHKDINDNEVIFVEQISEPKRPDVIYIDDDEYDEGIQPARLSRISRRETELSPTTIIYIPSDSDDSQVDSSDDEAVERKFRRMFHDKRLPKHDTEREDFSTVTLKSPPKSSPTSLDESQSTKAQKKPSEIEDSVDHTYMGSGGAANEAHLRSLYLATLANNVHLDVQDVRTSVSCGSSPHLLTKSPGKVLPKLAMASEERITSPAAPYCESNSSKDRDTSSVDTRAQDENFVGGIDTPLRTGQKMAHPSDMPLMRKIEHLDSQGIDEETGLPVSKFSVCGNGDNIIYDFEIRVKTSNIPNAGRGAFLTFLGARELKPSRKQWGEDLKKNRPPKYLRTLSEPATAMHPDGFGMAVTITGEHLRGPYNCQFPLRTLTAFIPDKYPKPEMRVRFANFEDPYCEEEIAGMRKDPGRIGSLGIYTDSDYVDAPKRTFSSRHSNCGVIDIGRYAPFQPSDRKSLTQFEVKSFLFGNVPNEWGFDTPEPLNDQPQMLDITDDLTGEPHEIACKNIPMYINEVGHDKKLIQTVWALDADDRNVNYFLAIDESMKPGSTIELLVAYEGHYELVRTRKGYGLSNLNGMEKSDDCFATFLKRNFRERRNVEDVISKLSPMEFYMLLEWLESISTRLCEKINKFMIEQSSSGNGATPDTCPSSLQFVALRRLTWLSGLFERKLHSGLFRGLTGLVNYKGLHDQCSTTIAAMKWPSWSDLFALLEKYPDINDLNGHSIMRSVEAEIVEEVCFQLRKKVVSPMNESLWCNVAIRLTKSLCYATVKASCRNQQQSQKGLFEMYIRLGSRASEELRQPSRYKDLAFYPKFNGVFAGVDEVTVAKLAHNFSSSSLKSDVPCEVLTRLVTSRRPVQGEKVPPELVVVPTPIEIFELSNKENMDNQSQKVVLEIQESWYLCWQVINIIHAFSMTFLSDSSYSLEQLCSTLSVDSNIAAYTLKEMMEKSTKTAKRIKRKLPMTSSNKPPKKPKSNKKVKRDNKSHLFWTIIWPCLTDVGWQLHVGTRPTDYYFCPPGVKRGKGFRNRQDYFDSYNLVLIELRSNPKWFSLPEVKEALTRYNTNT